MPARSTSRNRAWRAARVLALLAATLPPGRAQVPLAEPRPAPLAAGAQSAAGTPAKPKRPPREIAMAILFANRPLGTVQGTFPTDGSEPQVRGGELAERLGELVRPERLAQLRAAAPANQLLPLSRLKEIGLTLELDAATLELHLELPPAERAQVDLPLRQLGPPALSGVPLTPARHSAFANLRLAASRTQGGDANADPLSLHLRVEPSVDLGVAVLEGSGDWSRGANRPWQRGDLRLVHDDLERQRRWLFGDLAYPVAGFQAFRPMAGLAVARDFSLDPYRVVQPLGETDFLLAGDARVEVRVNGRIERAFRLGAGRYHLHDFFLETGLNDVVLLITDAAGREERIDLSLPFHADLLAPGLTSYAAALGLEAQTGASGPRYDAGRPMLSLLARRGWSSRATLGAGLQAGRQGVLGTGEALIATRWGAIGADLGLSFRSGSGCGGALRLTAERRTIGARNPRGRLWSVSGAFLTRGFLRLGESAETGARRQADLLLRVSQRLGRRATIGLSLSAESYPGATGLAGGGALSLRRALSPSSTLALDAGLRRTPTGRSEHRLALSWSWTLPDRRQQLHAGWDSLARSSRLDWSYSPTVPVDAWGAQASLSHAPGISVGAVDASWSGQRGEGRVLLDGATGGQTSLGVQAAASIVAIDGRVAFGRPINNAWALLAPHPSLAGLTLGADRSKDRFAVRAGRFGGVAPDLSPYLSRTLAIEISDLPPGYDPGPGLFRLLPRYKSGTLVPIGSGATLALAGTLVDATGAPVKLVSGQVADPLAAAEEPKIFFTNRAGRFRVEGLHPGHLELRLDDGRIVKVEVAAGRKGVVDLGALPVPAAVPAGGRRP